MNQLFQKLVGVLRKQVGVNSAIVPFSMGRIYQCIYRNWHHDPRPLIMIVGSDAFYTIGINIHYLSPAQQRDLTNYIMMMRASNVIINGLSIYKVMKYRYPRIVKRAFRKYFTGMLSGKIVSQGLSTAPELAAYQLLAEPYIKSLNKLISPPIFNAPVQPTYGQKKMDNLRSQIIQTSYNQDISKPFANRQQSTIVQYRQPDVEMEQEQTYQYPHEGD